MNRSSDVLYYAAWALGRGVVAGVLFRISMHPWLFWTGWLCLVPLCVVMQRGGYRHLLVSGWIFGITASLLCGWSLYGGAHDLLEISWPRSISIVTTFLSVYGIVWSSLWLGGAVILKEVLRFHWALALVLAALLLDWVRTSRASALAWPPFGATQIGSPLMLQTAELGGIAIVSGVVVGVNVLITMALVHRRSGVRWRSAAYANAALLILAVAFGLWRMRVVSASSHKILDGRTGEALRVALVQPSFTHRRPREPALYKTAVLRRLNRHAYEQGVHVVVWPELGHGAPWPTVPEYTTWHNDVPPGKSLLATVIEQGPQDSSGTPQMEYTSAVWVRGTDDSGAVSDPELYRKQNLFPIAERPVFGISANDLGSNLSGAENHGRGVPEPHAFEGNGWSVSTLICFDTMYSDAIQRAGLSGADWIAVLTNDQWYDHSAQLQHALLQTAITAIQTRLPTVRVAQTGISVVFDAAGRTVQLQAWTWPELTSEGVQLDLVGRGALPYQVDPLTSGVMLERVEEANEFARLVRGVAVVELPGRLSRPLVGHITPAWLSVFLVLLQVTDWIRAAHLRVTAVPV